MATAPAKPVFWVTNEVLAAMAAKGLREGSTVSNAELAAWCPKLQPQQRVHATSRLCALGFVQHAAAVVAGQRAEVYTVTAAGAAAIKVAGAGHVRKSGPKGTRTRNPHKPDSLLSRTWRLVRVRKVVDSESLAETLCLAGSTEQFAQVQANVRRYLRRWELVGAFDVGAKRINAGGNSNGTKRYVLREAFDRPEPPDTATRGAAA